MEAIVSRSAGIDIGKTVLKATLRVQGDHGRRTRREVCTFGTTTVQLPALRDWLVAEGVTLTGWRFGVDRGDRGTWSRAVKLDCVVSDALGKSARAMLPALIAGERDSKVLAELALGRLRPQGERAATASGRALLRAPWVAVFEDVGHID